MSRLKKLFLPGTFDFLKCDTETRTIRFRRASFLDELYEHLVINSFGKQNEAVVPNIGISVIRGLNTTKGLMEWGVIILEGADPERLWTIIESKEQAMAWERRLAEIATDKTAELARSKGRQLLQTTSNARRNAKLHLSHLPPLMTLEAIDKWLDRNSTDVQQKEAIRLAQFQGVLQILGSFLFYKVAALTLITSTEKMKPRSFPYGSSPLDDQELMWEIQVMVDLLYDRLNTDLE